MSIARFVRRITPPVLFDIFHRSPRRSEEAGNLWEGIYPHYRDVPVAGQRFDGETWVGKTLAYTERILASSRQAGTIPTELVGEHMLLPLLVSLVCREAGEKVSILDFGGGMGIAYAHLKGSLVNCRSIDYHVVEREGICEGGARLFEDDERIHFYPEIPAGLSDLDIVYISSALQYVEDYPSLLKRLSAFGARYFLFVKLSAGDFPTYATAQKNVPGTTLPYWFINVGEIIEIMAAGGYSLIYKSALEQEYDQSNFPEEYRLGRTCNLLFSRGSEMAQKSS
jgi:putative methyltransferase (TIGR04325 family)